MVTPPRFIVGLIVLAAAALTGVRAAEAGGVPRIACRQPVYEFGSSTDGQSVEHTFVIWNDGNAPLEIVQVRACCGSSASIAEKQIAPGSNTTLKATLSVAGRQGPVRKSFYIASNDPKSPYYQLQIATEVLPLVRIEPASADFGAIGASSVLEREVVVASGTGAVMTVTNVAVAGAGFSAAAERRADGSYVVRVRTVPPLVPGVARGEVALGTDLPGHERLRIPVVAAVQSGVVVVPKEILLVAAAGDSAPVVRQVAVRSRSGMKFKVLGVSLPEPGMAAEVAPLGEDGYRVALSNILPFAELDGKAVILATDHPDAKEVAIPIRVARPAPSVMN